MVNLTSAIETLYPLGRPSIDWIVSDSGSGPTITYWNTALGPLPTFEQLDAVTQAQVDAAMLIKSRLSAETSFDSTQADGKILRAIILLLINELNSIRGWTINLKAQTAAATSLANFQSRVATLPSLSDRTVQQAINAIKNKISTGRSD